MADIEWSRYPSIDEGQREALLRMATSLGVHPGSILEDPHGHAKLMAWVRMEEKCGEAARRSLEEAREPLRREAQEYVQTEHARLERSEGTTAVQDGELRSGTAAAGNPAPSKGREAGCAEVQRQRR